MERAKLKHRHSIPFGTSTIIAYIKPNRSKDKEILKAEEYDILDVVLQYVKLVFESNTEVV